MLSVACDLAVNFEVYTLSNSDTVCDECCVLTYTSDTHLRRLFVVISVMNSQYVSFRTPPQIHCRLTPICVWMCFQRSAFTKELRTLVAFLTRRFVCVCVQAVRSQDFLSIILGHSLRNYMRWMAWRCLLHAQRLQRSCVRYVQETLITFPLILFALCSLCMRMIRLECLGYAGCIFMTHLLSRQYVSFPTKPLDLFQWSN